MHPPSLAVIVSLPPASLILHQQRTWYERFSRVERTDYRSINFLNVITMASVVKLSVSNSAKYNRESVNPETAEVHKWFDINVTTNESYECYKRNADGTKELSETNAIQMPASVFIASFEGMSELGSLYAAAKPNVDRSSANYAAMRAAEAQAMLKGATLVVSLDKKEVGDIVNDEPLTEAAIYKTLENVIPSAHFVEQVFGFVRKSETVGFLFAMAFDASKTDAELAAEWLAQFEG